MGLSELIAKHVKETYVLPARAGGHRIVEVRAGDVHRALGLKNRVASVCTTLESQKFQRENHLLLWNSNGPASGRSTTVSFAYHLLDLDKPWQSSPSDSGAESLSDSARESKLMALAGLCAETFRALGGGEEFLRRERQWGPDAWEDYERELRERQVVENVK